MKELKIKKSMSFASCLIAKTCILIAIVACFMLAATGCKEDNNDVSSDVSENHSSVNSDNSETSKESSETSANSSNSTEVSDEPSEATSQATEESKPADNTDSTPKTFSAEGMSITLTNEFKETKIQNFTACYDSSKAVVFAIKESFSLLEGFENYTLEQYGDMVIKNNGSISAELKTTDGLTYFEYDYANPAVNQEYHYFAFVYKADDAFWLIQFAVNKVDAINHFNDIVGWAKSVKFS